MQGLPCYTESELRSPDGPHLPGLWTPAQIDITDPYAFFRDTDWLPVLNLAVITEEIGADRTTGYRLLTGSRSATEQTHPNVVSTPTQRITDHSLLEAILKDHFYNGIYGKETVAGLPTTPEMHLGDINPNHFAIIGNVNPHPTPLGRRATLLGQLTQKILAEKLGFDDWYGPGSKKQLMDAGLFPSIGTVSLSRLLAGFSYVGDNQDGEPTYEPIVMVGAVLHTPYPKLFPRTTNHYYENLSFTGLASFKGNVAERNVGTLITLEREADEVMMCVRGLCLSTGAEMSSGPDLIWHGSGFPANETYDLEKAVRFARLLAERDARGERLVARTGAILGRRALSDHRVAFERTQFYEPSPAAAYVSAG